ncbi:MAG: methylated-DNA--[protein]-cysteine S-methyltransferase [Clostridia bacterium]|nr:methylated-DNA--[protein]-cysteine S-methyltransferase [Clostridia bacterium]
MYFSYASKWGNIIYLLENESIKGIWFEDQKYFPDIEEPIFIGKNSHKIVEELKAYERKELREFSLDLEIKATPFQKMVWEVLLEIPYGETVSYKWVAQKVAQRMGKASMSSQAVGQAIGRNPFSIVIPCHRVISSSGKLTGYAGGIEKKEALLMHEKNDH